MSDPAPVQKKQRLRILILWNPKEAPRLAPGEDRAGEGLRQPGPPVSGATEKSDAEDPSQPIQEIVSTLRRRELDVWAFDLEDDPTRILDAVVVVKPALVLNLVDSFYGDASLQAAVAGYLDLLDVPYTGSEPLCLAMCLDRARTHILLGHAGIAAPAVQHDAGAQEGRLRRIFAIVLGNQTLEVMPLIEASAPGARAEVPWTLASLHDRTAERICELARRAFGVMGCRDIAEIEVHLGESDEPCVADVRPMLDLGPRSPFWGAAERTAAGYAGMLVRLIELAHERAGMDPDELLGAESELGIMEPTPRSRQDNGTATSPDKPAGGPA